MYPDMKPPMMSETPAPTPPPMGKESATVALTGPLASSFAGRNAGESVSITGKATIERAENGSATIRITAISAGEDEDAMDAEFQGAAKNVGKSRGMFGA